jgi:pseudaminic acid biosynthesis-associated methylase
VGKGGIMSVEFWSGGFGDEYTQRNDGDVIVKNNVMFFKKIFKSTGPITSVLELGCNKGLNLIAIDYLDHRLDIAGVDCNKKAITECSAYFSKKSNANFYYHDIAELSLPYKYDFVFTKGVLIHVQPDKLQSVYKRLFDFSSKYIMIAEYYNPTPVDIVYRGHDLKLYKRDFADDIMQRFPVKLIDYGFAYHGDKYPQDDLTWFLFEKEEQIEEMQNVRFSA